jgi:hypothetical protein
MSVVSNSPCIWAWGGVQMGWSERTILENSLFTARGVGFRDGPRSDQQQARQTSLPAKAPAWPWRLGWQFG